MFVMLDSFQTVVSMDRLPPSTVVMEQSLVSRVHQSRLRTRFSYTVKQEASRLCKDQLARRYAGVFIAYTFDAARALELHL